MNFLLAFLAGIAFYEVAMPILESATNLVISMISALTTKFNLVISQNQVKSEIIQRSVNTTTSAIGFEIPSEESDYYEDDECKGSNGRSIGF